MLNFANFQAFIITSAVVSVTDWGVSDAQYTVHSMYRLHTVHSSQFKSYNSELGIIVPVLTVRYVRVSRLV